MNISLKEYRKFVKESTYTGGKYWYAALGLAGETGEVVDEIKKVVRDDNSVLSDERKDKLILEMGDVLWYLHRLALDLDVDIQDVMQRNVDKLTDRRKNGKKTG